MEICERKSSAEGSENCDKEEGEEMGNGRLCGEKDRDGLEQQSFAGENKNDDKNEEQSGRKRKRNEGEEGEEESSRFGEVEGEESSDEEDEPFEDAFFFLKKKESIDTVAHSSSSSKENNNNKDGGGQDNEPINFSLFDESSSMTTTTAATAEDQKEIMKEENSREESLSQLLSTAGRRRKRNQEELERGGLCNDGGEGGEAAISAKEAIATTTTRDDKREKSQSPISASPSSRRRERENDESCLVPSPQRRITNLFPRSAATMLARAASSAAAASSKSRATTTPNIEQSDSSSSSSSILSHLSSNDAERSPMRTTRNGSSHPPSSSRPSYNETERSPVDRMRDDRRNDIRNERESTSSSTNNIVDRSSQSSSNNNRMRNERNDTSHSPPSSPSRFRRASSPSRQQQQRRRSSNHGNEDITLPPNLATMTFSPDQTEPEPWQLLDLDGVLSAAETEEIIRTFERAHGPISKEMYDLVLIAYCTQKKPAPSEAERVLNDMHDRGMNPDAWKYGWVIVGYGRLAAMPEQQQQTSSSTTTRIVISAREEADRIVTLMKSRGVARTVSVYNAWISACCRGGDNNNSNNNNSKNVEESDFCGAMEGYRLMREDGIHPNVVTFNALITCCSRVVGGADVERAFRFYDEMRSLHMEPDIFIFNSLITCCQRANGGADVERAEKLFFDGMVKANISPDQIIYGSMLMCYAEKKGGADFDKAQKLFRRIRDEIGMDNMSLRSKSIMLHVCGRRVPAAVDAAMELFWDHIIAQHRQEPGLQGGEEDTRRRESSTKESRPDDVAPDVRCFNIMLDVLSREEGGADMKKIKDVLDEMDRQHIIGDEITMSTVIAGCSRSGQRQQGVDWEETVSLYKKLRDKRRPSAKPEICTMNSLLTALSRSSSISMSGVDFVLDEMEAHHIDPNEASFNMLITICSRSEKGREGMEKAMSLFRYMKDLGIRGHDRVYTSLITACVGGGSQDNNNNEIGFVDLGSAMTIYREMVNDGIKPNQYTFSSLIHGCSKTEPVSLDTAKRLFSEMRSMRLANDEEPGAYNSMINLLSGGRKAGKWNAREGGRMTFADVKGAMEVYRLMVEEDHIKPTIITVNSLITCISRGRGEEIDLGFVEKIYKDMMELRIKPNVRFFSSVLVCCSRVRPYADVEKAEAVSKEMAKQGVEPNVFTFNNLMQVYRNGRRMEIRCIEEVMSEMARRQIKANPTTYSTILMCYVRCDSFEEWKRGVEVFDRIERRMRESSVYSGVIFILQNMIDYFENEIERSRGRRGEEDEGEERRRTEELRRREEEVIWKLVDVIEEAREARMMGSGYVEKNGREAISKIRDYRMREDVEERIFGRRRRT